MTHIWFRELPLWSKYPRFTIIIYPNLTSTNDIFWLDPSDFFHNYLELLEEYKRVGAICIEKYSNMKYADI